SAACKATLPPFVSLVGGFLLCARLLNASLLLLLLLLLLPREWTKGCFKRLSLYHLNISSLENECFRYCCCGSKGGRPCGTGTGTGGALRGVRPLACFPWPGASAK
ncbi:unnamed protein product, partial [Ectocarpus sp. 12 AP-2014]